MKVSALSSVTKLLSRISNQSSLTALYRSIELDKAGAKCCSEFGNIAIDLEDTGLSKAVLLDTGSVQGVANSLPADSDITFTEKENKLDWKCGAAKGHWNLVMSDHKIPALNHAEYPWTPNEKLPEALVLASSACQAAAVAVGLYGITIEPNGDNLHFLSSNSISLASAVIEKGTFPTTRITLRPPVPGIIAALITACQNCTLDVTAKGIFIKGDWLKAHLPLGANLEHNLMETAEKYQTVNHTAKIDGNAVKRFITRARSLTDKHASFTVALRVEQGKLVLTHAGIASSTEEFFLAEGLPQDINYNSVALPADMLLISLAHIETVVFDYLKDSTLVLRGTNPEFVYVIGGGE